MLPIVNFNCMLTVCPAVLKFTNLSSPRNTNIHPRRKVLLLTYFTDEDGGLQRVGSKWEGTWWIRFGQSEFQVTWALKGDPQDCPKSEMEPGGWRWDRQGEKEDGARRFSLSFRVFWVLNHMNVICSINKDIFLNQKVRKVEVEGRSGWKKWLWESGGVEDKGVDIGSQPPETGAQQSSVNQDRRDPFAAFHEPVRRKLNTLWGCSLTLNRWRLTLG